MSCLSLSRFDDIRRDETENTYEPICLENYFCARAARAYYLVFSVNVLNERDNFGSGPLFSKILMTVIAPRSVLISRVKFWVFIFVLVLGPFLMLINCV